MALRKLLPNALACGGCATAIQSGAAGQTGAALSRLDVEVVRETFVSGGIQEVFDFVAAQDVLPKILTGYGLVPGVVATSGVSGPWDTPGSHRTVHLADGSTAQEQVTDYQRPSYFAYRVSDPTFSLRYLMADARGQWWFTPADGGTRVRWSYTFRAKGPFSKLPLSLFAASQWGGYMDVCLKNVVVHFDPARSMPKPRAF